MHLFIYSLHFCHLWIILTHINSYSVSRVIYAFIHILSFPLSFDNNHALQFLSHSLPYNLCNNFYFISCQLWIILRYIFLYFVSRVICESSWHAFICIPCVTVVVVVVVIIIISFIITIIIIFIIRKIQPIHHIYFFFFHCSNRHNRSTTRHAN